MCVLFICHFSAISTSFVCFYYLLQLPFLIIGIQLCRYKKKSEEAFEAKMKMDHTYRILYGWAAAPYIPQMYLWEVFNASIKFGMVAIAILFDTKGRVLIGHSALIIIVFIATVVSSKSKKIIFISSFLF